MMIKTENKIQDLTFLKVKLYSEESNNRQTDRELRRERDCRRRICASLYRTKKIKLVISLYQGNINAIAHEQKVLFWLSPFV